MISLILVIYCLLETQHSDAVLQKSRTGTLKGTDQFGNQYYEQIDGVQHGRHRWVVYGDLQNYNTTSVPPEWHGWLHHITDDDPVSASVRYYYYQQVCICVTVIKYFYQYPRLACVLIICIEYDSNFFLEIYK